MLPENEWILFELILIELLCGGKRIVIRIFGSEKIHLNIFIIYIINSL